MLTATWSRTSGRRLQWMWALHVAEFWRSSPASTPRSWLGSLARWTSTSSHQNVVGPSSEVKRLSNLSALTTGSLETSPRLETRQYFSVFVMLVLSCKLRRTWRSVCSCSRPRATEYKRRVVSLKSSVVSPANDCFTPPLHIVNTTSRFVALDDLDAALMFRQSLMFLITYMSLFISYIQYCVYTL